MSLADHLPDPETVIPQTAERLASLPLPELTPTPTIDLSRYLRAVNRCTTIRMHGRVTQVIGLTIESEGPAVKVGELCYIYDKEGRNPIRAEVVGFKASKVMLMPLGELGGIGPTPSPALASTSPWPWGSASWTPP
jgi:hypothetical protein